MSPLDLYWHQVNIRIYRFVLSLVVLFFLGHGAASEAFQVEIDDKTYEIKGAEIEYYVENQTSLTIEQAIFLDASEWMVPEDEINFGYNSAVHWFRFFVLNREAKDLERLLEIAYPLLDKVELFVVRDDRLVRSFKTGDDFPFKQRPIDHRHFIFPLQFSSNNRTDIYLRIQTQGSLAVPLTLWHERTFNSEDSRTSMINAMYLGVLLIMAAFNLMLYFSIKEKSYLFYVFFVSSIFVLMTSLYGYSFQYFFSALPKVQSYIILCAVPIVQIAVSLFTIQFLQLAVKEPKWYRLFLFYIALDVINFGLVFIVPYSVATQISVFLFLPILGSAFFVSVMFWRRGDSGVKLYTLAWTTFLIGALAYVLNRLGVIPETSFIEQSIPLSTTVQTVLFALALASRFNDERDARLEAQQQHLEEIRKRREAEKAALYASSHHEITGLPNRGLFESSIAPYIKNPPEGRNNLTVVMLHVCRFDDVNKTLGHRNADILLQHVAERINGVMRGAGDALPIYSSRAEPFYAAHVEGVSFCFALANQSRKNIIFEVECLVRLMTQPIEFMGLSLEVGFLVGCTFSEDKEDDPHTLLRQAFIAFDRANEIAGPIAIYEPKMNPYSPKRLTLMTDLRLALDYDDLELFFQPQIELATQRVCGFEALIRWTHKEHGFVPPDEFIPMAERTGLMKPLTRWVIRKALIFSKELDDLCCDASISVNISALNLREPGFARQVRDLLRESGVSSARLVLEVTETAAMTDAKIALEVLEELQQEKIRLSIDDFGTGHSSLAYIRKLPVHEIKIDRSFVGEMDSNPGDATIVKTTINMCHDLGYEVVAEGVENQAVLDILQKMNCDIVQGYYIARPMCVKDARAWLNHTQWKLNHDQAS